MDIYKTPVSEAIDIPSIGIDQSGYSSDRYIISAIVIYISLPLTSMENTLLPRPPLFVHTPCDTTISLQSGGTPLMYARAGGHDECVKLLSGMGAQANQQNKVRPMCIADFFSFYIMQ